ncbi:MAG: hypothetical protein EXR94_12245 [Gemmatimonadetes bacterium]|nr:hypothetical protein [Gemmatimonadota bacterium]
MAEQLSRHYSAVSSPEAALDQAVAWALGRVGGQLRVGPAGTRIRDWTEAEIADLLADARLWCRVRSDAVMDPANFLERVVGGLLGAQSDGIGGRLELVPWLPDGWRTLVVRRLRVHRTLVDVDIRARAEWVTVRLAVAFGPPIAVALGLPGHFGVARVAVDEVPLPAERAIFTAAGEHEVTLYLGA